MSKPNLYEKIQSVSLQVNNISKDMIVGKGQYSYKAVSDNAVILAIKKAEKKHRLLSIPLSQELINSEILKTTDNKGKDSYKFLENIKMTTRIIDLDDTEKFIDVVSFGKGLDSGDKGFGKASTYARKYALLNAYKIATGEDPDKDKSTQISSQDIVSEQRKEVYSYLEKNINTLQQILSHFNVGNLSDLKDSEIETIYSTYKKKGLL